MRSGLLCRDRNAESPEYDEIVFFEGEDTAVEGGTGIWILSNGAQVFSRMFSPEEFYGVYDLVNIKGKSIKLARGEKIHVQLHI